MSFSKRHKWVGDTCTRCGLKRKRGAIRLPLSFPSQRKWKTGFLYFREKDQVSIYAPDCHGKEEKIFKT